MMKRLLALVLIAMMLCPVLATAFAEDTGIQMIGGPAFGEAETVNLDDMKVGKSVTIEGLGDVTIYKVEWVSEFKCQDDSWLMSGAEAEYLKIDLRIINKTQNAINYHSLIDNVVCNLEVDGNEYVFSGWHRQTSGDDNDARTYRDKDKSYDINPLYAGRYNICMTLPNIVVDSKEPLSVSFTIGTSEFTYHLRK